MPKMAPTICIPTTTVPGAHRSQVHSRLTRRTLDLVTNRNSGAQVSMSMWLHPTAHASLRLMS